MSTKWPAIAFAVLLGATPLFSDSLGVLSGRNIYLPFIPYYSFPGADPLSHPDTWAVESSYFMVNDIMVVPTSPIDTDIIVKPENKNLYLLLDYECSIWEESITRDWGSQGKLRLTMRLFSYRAGKGDLLIDGFHNWLGLPDANRSEFPQNQLYVNVSGTSGYHLYLTEALSAFGDTDLYYQKPFWNDGVWIISWGAALKLPTGSPETLSGSRRPDIGLQGIILRQGRKFNFHLQCGLVFPAAIIWHDESSPRISSQNLAGLEYALNPSFSIIGQLHVNTSFIQSPYQRKNPFISDLRVFETLQTNVRLGFILQKENYKVQFFFEEDPYTGEGSDIILNMGLSVFVKNDR